MSLLEQASLILTPNAFKTSKLYSVVPSDGAGDMTVVRATTATRVNENGLIEVVPRNLVSYSEQFDNASWSKLNSSTITANTSISPSGVQDADKYQASSLSFGGILRQSITITSGTTYTFSFFCKKDNYRYVGIRFNTAINGVRVPTYDFDTDTLNTQGATGVTLSRELFSNGWIRLILTYTTTTTVGTTDIVIASANGNTETTLTGNESIFVWGAQLEAGSTATEYFPTTTRLNIPRIDYTSGQGAILVEPQRTNLALYSEAFDNAYWTKSGATVVSGQASPSVDYPTSAFKLVESATTGGHNINKSITVTAGSNAISIRAKAGERNWILLRDTQSNTGRYFDLTNGVIGSVQGTTPLSSTIKPLADGWYDVSITLTAPATTTSAYVYVTNADATLSHTGDGTSGIYIYGAQLEAGSYPTSYIPTVASTVTRNADVISKTGISSLIGQTEGTWYYEGIINNTNSEFQILTSERNVSNTIAITRQTLNRVRARIWSNSTLSIDIISGSNVFLNTKSKIALSYVSGNVNLFYNGILVGSSTNSFAFSSNVDTIELSAMVDFFGSSLNTNNMDSVLIFKTVLTDAECIALTTL